MFSAVRGLFWILAFIVLGVFACSKQRVKHEADPDLGVGLRSQNITANIFLDATLSMKGYVRPGMGSSYVKTIQLIEGSINSGWSNGVSRFYRFGTRIEPLTGRDHLEATKLSFYDDTTINQETYIDSVLNRIEPDQLTLVITDLFQNDNDITLLTGQMKDKCIRQGLAIGIVGIGSQFAGDIYDVGIDRSKFYYQNKSDESDTFRPFYVLIMGKHADVAHLVDRLEKDGLPPHHRLILSRHLIDPTVQFRDDVSMDLLSRTIVEDTKILSSETSDRRVRQFKMRNSEAVMVTTSTYMRLPYTVMFDPLHLDIEVDTKKSITTDSLISITDTPQSLNLTTTRGTDTQFSLRWELNTTNLPGKGIYLYDTVVRPKASAYRLPDWVTKWDMPQDMIPRWQLEPGQFDGSTTLNLHMFIQQLWTSVVQVQRPYIAHFYCYIRKE